MLASHLRHSKSHRNAVKEHQKKNWVIRAKVLLKDKTHIKAFMTYIKPSWVVSEVSFNVLDQNYSMVVDFPLDFQLSCLANLLVVSKREKVRKCQ